MGYTEYYETVDYTWVVARALDRVAESMARIDYNMPGIGARRLYMAVEALVTITSPFVDRGVRERLREAGSLLRKGKPLTAIQVLEEVVEAVLRELDAKRILLRKTELLVGEYRGEE